MSWICPDCNRTFRNANQQHTCTLVTKDSLFQKRPPFLHDLYLKIREEVARLGDFREEAVRPDVIFFKTQSTFLAVKVKKDHLEVEFFLDHIEDQPPVKKYLQTSRRRVAHVVPMDNMEDMDAQLLDWIRASYMLIAAT